MKIVIVLSLLALLSNCNLLPIIAAAPDEDGVVKCIRDRVPDLTEASPDKLCGDPIDANAECYSNFNSLNLCLLNNKCFLNVHDTTVPLPTRRFPSPAGIAGTTCLSAPTSLCSCRRISPPAASPSRGCWSSLSCCWLPSCSDVHLLIRGSSPSSLPNMNCHQSAKPHLNDE